MRVEKKNSGERVDKFLKREIFFGEKTTRGEIIRQIRNGKILVGGKTVKPSYVLKTGDEIEINSGEDKKELVPNKDVIFETIYQDENIIAVNKPAGLQVHPGIRNEADTLANGLIFKFPEIKSVGDDPDSRPGIVHRLDKDTSGIMVVARNQETFEKLKDKFKSREIRKEYLAVVYGRLETKEGVIEKPIARAKNYKKQVIASRKTKTKIRPAITRYEVVREFESCSLVEVFPKTGRMHQIRVHMASIGHPIVGDKKYAKKNISQNTQANRQLLHAQKIHFTLDGKEYNFKSDMPEDMSEFMRFLD